MFIADNATTYLDTDSNSRIAVWDGNWGAYLDQELYQERATIYTAMNFAGTSNWATDLAGPVNKEIISIGQTASENNCAANSSEVCKLTWTTGSNETVEEASNIVGDTWKTSLAQEFLTDWLHTNGLKDWVLDLNEDYSSCNQTLGGSNDYCTDWLSSSCTLPATDSCLTDYNPVQVFFLATSIANFWGAFNNINTLISGYQEDWFNQMTKLAGDTFVPPASTSTDLISVITKSLGGISAGLGIVSGLTSVSEVGLVGSGLGLVGTIMSDLDSGGDDVTKELDSLVADVLTKVQSGMKKSVRDIFSPGSDTKLNASAIASYFADGQWLDSTLNNLTVNAYFASFNYTLLSAPNTVCGL